jgi:regulator of sigma E protease
MLITIIAGVFVLGAVILVHEFGHFVVAKWTGVYVRTFSIGFGKKLLRYRKGETDYALSILPFGGYVKFAGETEYYGEEEAAKPETPVSAAASAPGSTPAPGGPDRGKGDEIPDSEIPRERYFTTKRPAVRAAILFAGPFMNYLIAVLLYIGVTFVEGTQVLPTTIIGEIDAGSVADSIGFRAGDRITSIDGVGVENWGGVVNAALGEENKRHAVVVQRDGDSVDIVYELPKGAGSHPIGLRPLVPARVGRVKREEPAYRAGIREGAVIEAINDTTIASFEDLQRIVNANANVGLYIRWTQDGAAHADTIVPVSMKTLKPGTMDEFIEVGAIGLSPYFVKEPIGLGASFVHGFTEANEMIVRIVSYLGMLFTGKIGVQTLGGPILITQMAGDVARWGFDYLLVFLAFFSINLCIFNLMPLLPFDGGHLALLAYEAAVGRPVNRRLREIFMQVGFVLIIVLMLFVIMLDLSRCSGSSSGLF